MDLRDLSDEELVEECRRMEPGRRQRAIDELFGRHYERVARWCFRMINDREAAADLAQDVFLKAHRYLSSFKGHSRFSTWLYAIARNETRSRIKALAPQVEGEEILAELADLSPGPEEQADAALRQTAIRRFLDETLDETERLVFTLHFGDGVPLAAVTRLLGLRNESGAKAYIVSARRKLARAVQRGRLVGEES